MHSEYDDVKQEVHELKNQVQEMKLEAVRAQGRVDALRTSVAELEKSIDKLETSKVSLVAFNPIQKITYGVIGSILIAFLAALISLVIIPTEKKQYSIMDQGIRQPEIRYETKTRPNSP